MALDEPKDEDETHEIHGITLLVDKSVAEMVKNYGHVKIDYLDYPWGGQIVVKAGNASECC